MNPGMSISGSSNRINSYSAVGFDYDDDDISIIPSIIPVLPEVTMMTIVGFEGTVGG